MLATPQGYLYMPNSVVGSRRWRDKIAAIRFYQEIRTDVVAQVVKGPGFVEADSDLLRQEIEGYMRGRLRVAIQFVDSIEQTAGGKYRLVVSKVPNEM
jgi:phenylacetate-CoA ligase